MGLETNFKREDISPVNLEKDQQKAMFEDIDFLKSQAENFVSVNCPACDEKKSDPVFEKYGMQHVHCRSCDTQYISPRPTLDILKEFYRKSKNYAYWSKHIFPATAETRRTRIFRPRAELIARLAKDHGFKTDLIVEIGAAYGFFCEEMKRLNLFKRVIGVEPTPDLAQICRDKGIEILEDFVEDVKFPSAPDVIANFEVIEHLFAPKSFLDACFERLNTGGVVVLTCPNIAGFETQMLREHSDTIDHEHLNYFSPESLSLLMKRVGFEIVQISTPGVLDCDIVYEVLKKDSSLISDSIWKKLLLSEDENNREQLQQLLQNACLSSNMMAIGRKP